MHRREMLAPEVAAFIAINEDKEPDLAFVTKSYGEPETPWAASRSDYEA